MLSLMALGENVSLRAAAPGQLSLLLKRVGSQLRGVFFCPQYGLCVHSAARSKNIAFPSWASFSVSAQACQLLSRGGKEP